MAQGLSRRDFGRLMGSAGLGLAAPALAGGCGTASRKAATRAGTRTWRVSGTAGAGLGGFDTAVKSLMQARNIPCGSLAVMRKGKLVLARGYTWSDDAALSVQPTSLFRLASLSKAVTATAVTRLVQDGKLSLSARVTDLLTLTPPPGQSADPRLGQVTVRRLLQHLGGWDRDISGDPTYRDRTTAKLLGVPLPITREHMVQYGTGLKLDHDPGSTFAYSNYGYLLLGQIIAKAAGTSYEQYVQENVLAPMGITRMRPGRSLAAGRAAGEVPYFSQRTGPSVFDEVGTTLPAPYGTFNVENRTPMGGWLASAVDYVRFTQIHDGGTSVLGSSSIASIFAKPETGLNSGGSYYGFGWYVRDVTGGRNTWHSGALDGTSTIVTRRYDGVTWALLFDQRDDPSGLTYEYDDFSAPLHKVANALTTWPSTNLFSTYF
ncbi:CubicO group peptidase (beta-lactamase class C family) [Actinomadura luteofluorescens]|uniref:CubicO group peptidase (Beta-lactamase class C family) n=1 Tax=Actinomadura luteofluorescens TaxID=46163 RepID=A0A7Y9EP83_9ACTN|nr:serine hydrolase domain-containing protein [Actinomadura luteofluorescens]NYD51420.1 CubicO group peptidase (beta-lactamase class C family) [Actinomadura luteofluorescens]